MILGIAGGNGLEHISKDKFEKVYGVDVNFRQILKGNYKVPGIIRELHSEAKKKAKRSDT